MPLINSTKFLYFSIAYSLFIIYGSLVPLNYQAKPFDEAWLAFSQIRYLNLGVASRADWIANIVLYIPLTFCLAAAFSKRYLAIISPFILLFSLSLAITIEFYQQFFPPRTVSQNDLIAETMGSVIGLVLWFSYGQRLIKLQSHILQGGKQALLASGILYAIGYLALSFFPYDFVTSLTELQHKLAIGNDAFFILPSCGGFIFCSSKLIIEIIVVLPLAVLLSVLLKNHRKPLIIALSIGFVVSLFIELVQLFIISGIAQGISVFTRLLGIALGGIIYQQFPQLQTIFRSINFKIPLLWALIPYSLLVAHLSGWSLSSSAINHQISDSINAINWLPFYYHYYTTEAVALTSLLSIFALFIQAFLKQVYNVMT